MAPSLASDTRHDPRRLAITLTREQIIDRLADLYSEGHTPSTDDTTRRHAAALHHLNSQPRRG